MNEIHHSIYSRSIWHTQFALVMLVVVVLIDRWLDGFCHFHHLELDLDWCLHGLSSGHLLCLMAATGVASRIRYVQLNHDGFREVRRCQRLWLDILFGEKIHELLETP